jgi:rhodanese-related sulfurtransferase
MNWTMLGMAIVAAVGIWAFVVPKAPKGYEVRAMSAKEMSDSKAVIVDIRRPDEWRATGVVKGAKLITFTTAENLLAEVGPLAEGQPLVLICHSGRRSAAAASALVGKVKGPIISYDGGMAAWIAAKGQITKAKM